MFGIMTAPQIELLMNLVPYGILVECAMNLFYYFTALWMLCTSVGYTTLVDAFWPLAFLIVNWTCNSFAIPIFADRQQIVIILVTTWIVRLSTAMALRAFLGKGESAVYKAQQRVYGSDYWWMSYFTVFMAQMFQVLIISMPLINILTNPSFKGSLTIYDYVGTIVWCVGFYFETLADYQLYVFTCNEANKYKTLSTGLWALSRHPNYFGETLVWFGIFIINLNYNNGIYFFFCPLFVTLLMYFLSGANVTEPQMLLHKADYVHYVKTTPAFFPRLPTKESLKPMQSASQTTSGH